MKDSTSLSALLTIQRVAIGLLITNSWERVGPGIISNINLVRQGNEDT